MPLAKGSTTMRRILSDAHVVMAEAKHWFEIRDQSYEYHANPRGKLNVIAVIGEGFSPIHGNVNQALLCEIGIGRTRPYSQSNFPRSGCSHANCIKDRKKVFSLQAHQYELIAPHLFRLLQELTNAHTSAWKCNYDNPFFLTQTKYRWSKTVSRIAQFNSSLARPTGVRFSIMQTERYLLEDIYWAEMYGNEILKKQLSGFANLLAYPLRHYRRIKTKRRLKALPKYNDICAILDCGFPPYLKIRMMDFLPDAERNYFGDELNELLSWDGSATWQDMTARRALQNSEHRLGDIQLRLTHKHARKDLHVFEVHASENAQQHQTDAHQHDIMEQEIPF